MTQDNTAQNWHPIPRHEQVFNQRIVIWGLRFLAIALFIMGLILRILPWWLFLIPIVILVAWLLWSFHVSEQFTDPVSKQTYWFDEHGYAKKGVAYGSGWDVYCAILRENDLIDAINSKTNVPSLINDGCEIEVRNVPHTHIMEIYYPTDHAITDSLAAMLIQSYAYTDRLCRWTVAEEDIQIHEIASPHEYCLLCEFKSQEL